MTDYAGLIATSSVPWLIAAALVLGALHALEPGHAKTMMAAFIVATKGSAGQAALLGLSAAVSHSLLVWVLAAVALIWGNEFIDAAMEPYLQLASGTLIIVIGASVILRQQASAFRLKSGSRMIRMSHHQHDHQHDHGHDDGHLHHHNHAVRHEHVDAHTRAHAAQLARHLPDRPVTNTEVVLFGFSGGLMPCPAAFTALLVCLRLKQAALGFALVLSFSAGLAATLIAIGVSAALAAHHARRLMPEMPRAASALPYLSGALIIGLGVFILLSAWTALA